MATSLDTYPNSYDLMAIEPIVEILEKYLCDIEWAFKFQKSTLKEKKQIIEDISLEIDQKFAPKDLKECQTCNTLKESNPTPDGDEVCPNCGDREMLDKE